MHAVHTIILHSSKYYYDVQKHAAVEPLSLALLIFSCFHRGTLLAYSIITRSLFPLLILRLVTSLPYPEVSRKSTTQITVTRYTAMLA